MNVIVDATGRPCPQPVIELARAVRDVAVGDTVTVIADDPAAATDIPAWCRLRGQQFVGASPTAAGTEYVVRRID